MSIRTVLRAGARVLVGSLCVALAGCGVVPHSAPDRRALLEDLRAQPGRIPSAPSEGTRTVLLTVGIQAGTVRPDGNAIPVGGTLGLERGLARRRAGAPKYWVLQTAGGENVHYWTPLDPSPRVRVNLPVDRKDQSHLDELVEMPEMYVALRLPFFPEGTVEFYEKDGTPAGSFRFGREPSSPLVQQAGP